MLKRKYIKNQPITICYVRNFRNVISANANNLQLVLSLGFDDVIGIFLPDSTADWRPRKRVFGIRPCLYNLPEGCRRKDIWNVAKQFLRPIFRGPIPFLANHNRGCDLWGFERRERVGLGWRTTCDSTGRGRNPSASL